MLPGRYQALDARKALSQIRFDDHGLVPVVIQDAQSGEVLTLAYANAEAVALTLESGDLHLWSRSREEIWRKGATSGNTQRLVSLRVDCDEGHRVARDEGVPAQRRFEEDLGRVGAEGARAVGRRNAVPERSARSSEH